MRNLSSAFKDELNNDNRYYLEWVDITLKDGTVLNLTNKDIWNYGIKIEDAVSGTSDFQVGSAIVNKATITLNNIYDDFSDYLFDGASITVYAGLEVNSPNSVQLYDSKDESILDSNGEYIYTTLAPTSIEKIRMFTGTIVETPTTNSSILSLTCYDNMYKFDRDYSESTLQYPATRSEIIRDACDVCGVSLQTPTFDNDNYVIKTRPDDEQLTFRQLISWVAQIGGQWCRCDSYGRLCIGWYDLSHYESDENEEKSFIRINSYDSLSVNNEDVVITGVRVVEYNEEITSGEEVASYLYGSDGYIIEIADNKMIQSGTGNAIAEMIGKRIVGMCFRPFSTTMMNVPSVEAGDICIIADRKGNLYKSLITSTTFQVGNKQKVECGAKSAVRNSAKQYSMRSQDIVEQRKQLKKEKIGREKQLQELANRIANSSGLYTTIEKNAGGGSTYYLHNKLDLASSDIVWKMTAEAWGVSTDGGETWNGGMTVDGDTVVRILDAVGIRANWIHTGEFKVEDKDGNEMFYVNCDTGIVRIKAQSFSLTNNKTIEDIAYDCIDEQLDKFGKLLTIEFTSNSRTYQNVNSNGNPSPNYEATPLVITPIIRFKNTEISENVQVIWKKKTSEEEEVLGDGETVTNGVLTVRKNLDSDTVRYICYATYTVSESEQYVANGYLDFVRVRDGTKGEDATTLRIESSRGTVFKNDSVATVLSVVIYRGAQRITDSTTLKSVFGNSAYLQWKWQRLDDESFGIILAGDNRITEDGFSFILSPDDVDTKVTFMCELIV